LWGLPQEKMIMLRGQELGPNVAYNVRLYKGVCHEVVTNGSDVGTGIYLHSLRSAQNG
jgi:hypothetical protein